jgi:hypothetical protein
MLLWTASDDPAVKQQLIPLEDAVEWEAALHDLPHSFAQTSRYCSAIAQTTGQGTFLYTAEGPAGRVVCPVAERRYQNDFDIVSLFGNGGFTGIGTIPDFASEWSSFMRDQGYVCAYIALNQVFDWTCLFPVEQLHRQGTMFSIDLSSGLDDLNDKIGRNNRRLLKRWAETGAMLLFDQNRLKTAFVQLYPNFIDDVGAGDVYDLKNETFSTLFGLEDVYLIGAERGGTIEAVRCFISTPNVADAFLEANVPGIQDHSRAIYWAAIKHFKQRNVALLNMGGGIEDGDSLTFFKSGFATERRPFFSIKQIFDEERFEALCRTAGMAPDTTGYFPPYHQTVSKYVEAL